MRRLAQATGIALGALVFVLLGALAPGAPRAVAATAPTAVVAVGDSSASGEGAGDYEPGTRGENGDWCHRSVHAYIRQLALSQVSFNLACSGATSGDVGFGNTTHYTEGSQAARLVQIAQSYQVRVVVVQVGANDDPSFSSSVVLCVAVFLNPSAPGCATTLASQWPQRLAAMAPKVQKALRDVRTAMQQAGYTDADYALVVASYASPVTETMIPAHGLFGCPYRASDAQWGRTSAVPELSAALRGVAGQVGARFLDLSRATEGHEACTSAGPEWVRRLTVNPRAFVSGGLAAVGHLAQESFHPNASAHAQLARCLAAFVQAQAGSGQCVPGQDRALHLRIGGPVPAAMVPAGAG